MDASVVTAPEACCPIAVHKQLVLMLKIALRNSSPMAERGWARGRRPARQVRIERVLPFRSPSFPKAWWVCPLQLYSGLLFVIGRGA